MTYEEFARILPWCLIILTPWNLLMPKPQNPRYLWRRSDTPKRLRSSISCRWMDGHSGIFHLSLPPTPSQPPPPPPKFNILIWKWAPPPPLAQINTLHSTLLVLHKQKILPPHPLQKKSMYFELYFNLVVYFELYFNLVVSDVFWTVF